ncbi:MAG TPA: hypothetical protein VMO00_02265 [Methylomirabilota bacterium]|nr:hypothetical protein [Methylomirabilota bacterium]
MKKRTRTLENACKEFEADLVLYYYGDDSEADHRRVERHCEECSLCRRFLADLRELLPQMAKPQELPPRFWDDYHNEMVEKLALHREQSPWWRNFFAPVRAWALPAFGTAAVAVLTFALIFGKGTSHLWPSHSQGNIPQEILADTNQLEFFDSMDMLESLHTLEALDGTRTAPTTSRHS